MMFAKVAKSQDSYPIFPQKPVMINREILEVFLILKKLCSKTVKTRN